MRHSVTIGFVVLLAICSTATADDGFKSIFNGKDLTGWDGREDLWQVKDGAIVGTTTDTDPIKYNQFLIWRGGELDDFEIKLEYKISSGNSGIQYRSFESTKVGPYSIGGYQADFEFGGDENGDKWSGCNYGEQYRGVLAKRGEATVINDEGKCQVITEIADADELYKSIKDGDWNEYHIIARGYTFVHKINGVTMSIVSDEDTDMRRRSGLLAIQIHGGPAMQLMVRNIRLKRLPMTNKKKVVFIAGNPSHGYGQHKHDSANTLMAQELNDNMPQIHATVYAGGWPTDPTALDNADAIVVYSDGGGGHPAIGHLDEIDAAAKRGVGIAMLHYGVEVEKEAAGKEFLRWIGGYFETYWSVNPHWTAEFKELPEHPITRGVKPFTINDEWYYNMRFVKDMKNVTPLLSAVPPMSTIEREDGPHSNNKFVREMTTKRMPTHLAWAYERKDGGRGFGFTGGHYLWSWANDDFRTFLLNAVTWIAKVEVPADGVPSPTPTVKELIALQSMEKPADFDEARIEHYIKTGDWK